MFLWRLALEEHARKTASGRRETGEATGEQTVHTMQQQHTMPCDPAAAPRVLAAVSICTALRTAAAAQEAAQAHMLRRLLCMYRGVLQCPNVEECVMLSSCQIAVYDPGGLVLIGEEPRPARYWSSPYMSNGTAESVLSERRLARELRPAAARLVSGGDKEWARAVSLSKCVRLKLPCEEKLACIAGDSWVSFGRHAGTLSVHVGHEMGHAGHLSLGQYENVHHESLCSQVPEITLQHLDFVLSVFRSLWLWPCQLVRPRCQLIRCADTVEHTDRQRGETVSAVRFFEFGVCALFVRLDTFMCVSLCKYRGVYVVPMSLHPDPNRVMPDLKVYVWDLFGVAHQGFLPASVLDGPEWERVGMLEKVVYGLDKGCVMCSDREDSKRPGMGAKCSSELSVLTVADCILQAGRNPFPVFPHKWACIGWDARWNGFYGCMLIHVFAGDGSVPRVHVYSRNFGENPTCATSRRTPVKLFDVPCSELRSLYVTGV